MIGDYLTEINVTCPTCIRELDAQFGLDIAGDLWTLSQVSVKRPVFATLRRDRFCFTTLLAIGIHAVLVLGISFEKEAPRATTEPLAIKLQQGGDALTLDGVEITPNNGPSQSDLPPQRKPDQQTFNLADLGA